MSFPVIYERASHPTQGPTPGARAILAWSLANYRTATSLGIYNNRSVRGGSSLSTHAEGRAIDVGFPATVGGTPEGWALANAMRIHHRDLGVQGVIYARRIWTNTQNDRGWRQYNGKAAHNEHVHIELTRQAGRELTHKMINQATGVDMATTKEQEAHNIAIQGALVAAAIDIGDSGPAKNGIDGDIAGLTVSGVQQVCQEVIDLRIEHAHTLKELAAAQAHLADRVTPKDDDPLYAEIGRNFSEAIKGAYVLTEGLQR